MSIPFGISRLCWAQPLGLEVADCRIEYKSASLQKLSNFIEVDANTMPTEGFRVVNNMHKHSF
jgi:hypothetical protein